VITLTRLSGKQFALNSDLIERVEANPDTTVTLIDGSRYIVRESVATVSDLVEEYRARMLARTRTVPVAPVRPTLEVVQDTQGAGTPAHPAQVTPIPAPRTK